MSRIINEVNVHAVASFPQLPEDADESWTNLLHRQTVIIDSNLDNPVLSESIFETSVVRLSESTAMMKDFQDLHTALIERFRIHTSAFSTYVNSGPTHNVSTKERIDHLRVEILDDLQGLWTQACEASQKTQNGTHRLVSVAKKLNKLVDFFNEGRYLSGDFLHLNSDPPKHFNPKEPTSVPKTSAIVNCYKSAGNTVPNFACRLMLRNRKP